MNAIEECTKLLMAIFKPEDVIEFRPLPKAAKRWGTIADLPSIVPWLESLNRDGKHAYFGANPRTDTGGSKAADVALARCLFADFDGGIQHEEAIARIEQAGLPRPTAIVFSGGGCHAWWRLSEPVKDLMAWTARQKLLIKTLGSDKSIHDAPRIMRLPGFVNGKYEGKPVAIVVEVDATRIYGWDEMVPRVATGRTMSASSRAFVDNGTLLDAGRRGTIFAVACDLHAREWSLAEATDAIMPQAQALGLTGEDLDDIPRQIENAFREPRTPLGAKPVPVDTSDEVDSIPLQTRQWPSRPNTMLSHGVVGDLLARAEAETEADPVAIAVTFLVSLGNVIGRGPHAIVDGNRHGVNLFATIVGGTSEGRKGTSMSIVRAVFRDIDEEWVRNCRTPGLTSGEGLIDLVRDDVYSIKENKKTGAVESYISAPGVNDKRLIFECQEFAAVMRAGKSERSTLFPTMREAWDGQDLRTPTKNNPRRVTDPHISGVAHITPEELFKLQTDADIYGGTWNRFLWIGARRARLCPHGGNFEDLRDIQDRVRSTVNHALNVGQMRRTEAANRLWEAEYYRRADNLPGGIVGAILGRAEAQILRLSMLAALCRGETMVDEVDLAAALDLWKYADETVRSLFGHNEDPIVQRIVQAVRDSPGISRSELHRAAAKTMAAVAFVAALSRAASTGGIIPEIIETAGRPREEWRPRGLEKVSRPATETLSPIKPFSPTHPAEASLFGRTL